jgi:hypothetical protein
VPKDGTEAGEAEVPEVTRAVHASVWHHPVLCPGLPPPLCLGLGGGVESLI